MTAPPALLGPDGKPFPLGPLIASGGEGAVFALPRDPARVAKVYHRAPSAQTAEKLAAMAGLASARLLAVAAWPTGLLTHAKTGHVAGFVMPRLADCQPVQHLYNPVQRLKSFPRASWAFQVRAAANLAAAFDEVHRAGCLVGDVNQSNALVSPQALARLIDCDSFQVRAGGRQFLCEVGVPHYTPPELQGKPLRGLTRTENHDRFGLAVLVYQMLFVGRHPYAGVYTGAGDLPFDQLIAEFRFAQGPQAKTWGMEPPPHTPTFADIPPDVGTLFRRAFERGSEAGNRPGPAEWLATLGRLEADCAECPADPGHRYWRGAASCAWCRLAERGGPEYYFGVAGGAAAFAVDEGRLQEVTRRLAAARPADFELDHAKFAPAESPQGNPLPADLDEHRSNATLVGAAAGLSMLAVPLGLYRWPLGLVALLGAAIFGAWFASLLLMSPLRRERGRRNLARRLALADLRDLKGEWEERVRRYRRGHDDLGRRVRDLVAQCRGLAGHYQAELRRLTADAESAARLRHLRLHQIADAGIPKIGPGRVRTLAAHHVTTAADIDYGRVRDIKGFGEALTDSLVAWRDEVLSRFRFDPAAAVPVAEQRAVTVRLRAAQQRIIAEADGKLAEMDSLAPACRARLQELVPDLKDAAAAYEQAWADLAVLDEKG